MNKLLWFVGAACATFLFPLTSFAANNFGYFDSRAGYSTVGGRYGVGVSVRGYTDGSSYASGNMKITPDTTVTISGMDTAGSNQVFMAVRDGNNTNIGTKFGQGEIQISGADLAKMQDPQIVLRTSDGTNLSAPLGEKVPLKVTVDSSGTKAEPPPFLADSNQNNSSAPVADQTQSSSSNSASSGGGGGSGSKTDALVPCNGAQDCTLEKLLDLGANIYNFLVGLGALGAVAAIVVAGFTYIRSAGDAKVMQDAKHRIVLAIIGLVVLGGSVLLVNTVLDAFKAKIGKVENVGGK